MVKKVEEQEPQEEGTPSRDLLPGEREKTPRLSL
jgi:hypothetical protein